jgi:hypothetical protein
VVFHVDILKNDFGMGVQRRVARLFVNGRGVDVDMSDEPERWKQKLVRPILDEVGADLLDPETAPKDFLRVLAKGMQGGTYLVALGPHDEGSCVLTDDGLATIAEADVARPGSRQDLQRSLVDAAERLPGVADIVETYGRLEPHVGRIAAAVYPSIQYATGGNVSRSA